MLKFIDENDFLEVDTFKENEDGSVSWIWDEGENLPTHSGVIFEGFTRTDSEGVTVNVWEKLLEKEIAGLVTIQWLTDEDRENLAQQEQINNFKAQRKRQLDDAVITTESGNKYDADEQSISRMANAIIAAQRSGVTELHWSLADTGTGIMTDIPLSELEEAHELAVINMASIWSI